MISDLIKKYFGYLTDSYDFSIISESESEVVFKSDVCCVRFLLERGQVFIDLGPGFESWSFDLGEIILWKDPNSRFGYAFGSDVNLDQELSRLAVLLKKYCDNMLKGDFSMRNDLEKFRKKRWDTITHASESDPSE